MPLAFSPALASTLVLAVALALFASNRVRHDLVALLALAACLLLGLTPPQDAFVGFADQSVIVIVAVLIIGRAVEITGVRTPSPIGSRRSMRHFRFSSAFSLSSPPAFPPS